MIFVMVFSTPKMSLVRLLQTQTSTSQIMFDNKCLLSLELALNLRAVETHSALNFTM